MGQSLKKLASGSDDKKKNEIIEKCWDAMKSYDAELKLDYDYTFKAEGEPPEEVKKHAEEVKQQQARLYRAVCGIVEEINSKLGNTQFQLPTTAALEKAFKKHRTENEPLTRKQFENILKEVIGETGFSGIGIRDALLYLFGVPVTALFVKETVMPDAIANDIFTPAITSITAVVLAMLNKI